MSNLPNKIHHKEKRVNTVQRSPRFPTLLLIVLGALVLFLPVKFLYAGVLDSAQIACDQGTILAQQERYAEAVTAWSRVAADFPDAQPPDPRLRIVKAEALAGSAEASRKLGRLDEAFAAAAKVLSDYPQCRPSCAEATIICAKVCEVKQDFANAAHYWAFLLKNYPDKRTRADLARGRLGDLLEKKPTLSSTVQAEIDAAIPVYEAAKREEDEITAARRAAKAKGDTGDLDGARTDLLTLFANPAVAGSRARLGSLYSTQMALRDVTGAKATAERLYELAAEEMNPEEYRLLRLLTKCILEDFAGAVQEGKDALLIYSDAAGGCAFRYNLAYAYDRLGETDKALELHEDIISRYTSWTDHGTRSMVAVALARKAKILEKRGSVTEALELYNKVVTDYAGTEMAGSAANSLKRLQEQGGR